MAFQLVAVDNSVSSQRQEEGFLKRIQSRMRSQIEQLEVRKGARPRWSASQPPLDKVCALQSESAPTNFSSTKWTLQPVTFAPATKACRCASSPGNDGSKLG